jgi:hypothetical protein
MGVPEALRPAISAIFAAAHALRSAAVLAISTRFVWGVIDSYTHRQKSLTNFLCVLTPVSSKAESQVF